MDVESANDLKMKLKEMGYSERAIEEILKWYKENDSRISRAKVSVF